MTNGFAVLDFETTGVAPGSGDRVVEVGAVCLDSNLHFESVYETLVNPKRDVGLTSLHGVTARDVFDAPTFDQIAPSLMARLDGRVIVGHNVAFDLRFLAAELERAGHPAPEFVAIDTMQVARRMLRNTPPPCFKLMAVAEHLGCNHQSAFAPLDGATRPAHSALGDALVTARILDRLFTLSAGAEYWSHHLQRASQTGRTARVTVTVDVTLKPRPESSNQAPRPAPAVPQPSKSIGDVLHALGSPAPSPAETSEYVALLDAAMEDRILDAAEVDALAESARRLGLDTVTLGSLHRGHFDGVVREAWADGILTEQEAADIVRVAELLGIDDDSLRAALGQQAQAATTPTTAIENHLTLSPGSIIVLTGDMTVPRNEVEAEIEARGFVVGKNITKKAALLIAADSYTQSRKAQKAREYGIQVLDEADGLALIRK